MKNIDKWRPTKFVYKNDRLIASRDIAEMSPGSKLIADVVAHYYQTFLPKYASGKLLDLGCGYVPFYATYKDYINECVCVDWENTLHKNEYLDLECDLTKELPFNDEEFDTIILSDVLEHIPNPEKLWREMHRVLKRGGILILNVPFYYWLHEGPNDFYRYTHFALRRFTKLFNFTIKILEPIGGVPEILADILSKNSVRLPKGILIASFIQYLTSAFVKTGVGNKISKNTAKVFPLGYFLVAEKS